MNQIKEAIAKAMLSRGPGALDGCVHLDTSLNKLSIGAKIKRL